MQEIRPQHCLYFLPEPQGHGSLRGGALAPDGYSLDNFYLARPGADEVQLDLFGDYKSNVALYPEFQAYFRKHKPPFLAAWARTTLLYGT